MPKQITTLNQEDDNLVLDHPVALNNQTGAKFDLIKEESFKSDTDNVTPGVISFKEKLLSQGRPSNIQKQSTNSYDYKSSIKSHQTNQHAKSMLENLQELQINIMKRE